MACSKTAFIEFKDCESSYLFEVELTPSTSYFYEITDKFGNVYQKAFTTDDDGYFSISPNDFPPYLFTNAGGNFTLIVKESLTDCGAVDFDYCEDTFDTIVFSFIKNAENGNVPIVDKCQKVYDCLGISESGEANKFLNEQGDFVTVSGFTCSDLSTCSTTNLSEGTRLYFTDGRAVTALTGQNISLLNNDSNYLTSSTASSTYEPIITSGTTSQYYRGDKTFQNLDKSTIGLNNVDNTSDSSKPISIATQTALDLKANKATQRSGSVIAFDTDANYGTIASPLTGNITGDYTDAIIGVVQLLIHNDGVAPTIPATWIKANTSSSYTTGVVNYIAVTWLSSNIATYTIWKSV